jgi:hypothetical protein
LRGVTETGFVASYNKNTDFDDNVLVGLYSTIDLYSTIFGLEYSLSKKPSNKYFSRSGIFYKPDFMPQIVFNINRRLSEKIFFMFEYFYNDFGYTNQEFNEVVDLLKTNYSTYGSEIVKILKPGYVLKNYFFTSFSYEIYDNITFLTNILTIPDFRNGFIYPHISWTKINNLTFSLEYITHFSLRKDNEFSLIPYNYTFLLRTQHYF